LASENSGKSWSELGHLLERAEAQGRGLSRTPGRREGAVQKLLVEMSGENSKEILLSPDGEKRVSPTVSAETSDSKMADSDPS